MKDAATLTVAQFCDTHHVSRTHLYQLLKDGRGPRLMKVGRRTLISQEAAAEWRARIEQETASQAKSFWEGGSDPALLAV